MESFSTSDHDVILHITISICLLKASGTFSHFLHMWKLRWVKERSFGINYRSPRVQLEYAKNKAYVSVL